MQREARSQARNLRASSASEIAVQIDPVVREIEAELDLPSSPRQSLVLTTRVTDVASAYVSTTSYKDSGNANERRRRSRGGIVKGGRAIGQDGSRVQGRKAKRGRKVKRAVKRASE